MAFRTSVLLRLFHDIVTYGGVDPSGVFPLFLKMVADIIAPKLHNFSWAIPLGIISQVLEVR